MSNKNHWLLLPIEKHIRHYLHWNLVAANSNTRVIHNDNVIVFDL